MQRQKYMDLHGALVCGNKFADICAEGGVAEEDFLALLDYCMNVLIAENGDELLDAMYYCLQAESIFTDRSDDVGVLAAYVAKHNRKMWTLICDAIEEIVEDDFEDYEELSQSTSEFVRVTGYDLFMGNLQSELLDEVADVLVQKCPELLPSSISVSARGDEWHVERVFDADKILEDSDLEDELARIYQNGQLVADKLNCKCLGCELHVEEFVNNLGKAAQKMMVH